MYLFFVEEIAPIQAFQIFWPRPHEDDCKRKR